MIAVMIASCNQQAITAETNNQTTQQEVSAENTDKTNQQVSTDIITYPKNFKGTSSKGIIKLKWKKDTTVKGYILYRNGKKIKNLKKTENSYKDKKVKLNKTYKYKIQSYKKINGKKVNSKKSYTIKIRATDSNSKKLNAARITNVKKTYNIGPGESIKIKPRVKLSKKLKGKKAKKKKVYSKKIYYKSSNSKLVSVSKKGVIKATSDKRYESAIITVRTHNGIAKKIKVNIVNFAQIRAVKNLDQVRSDVTKRILTTTKRDTSKIAEYFQNNPTEERITLKEGDREVRTEDGGITHEICIEMSDDIQIEDDMYDFILKYMLNNYGVEVVVDANYVYFRYKQYYAYGIEAHDLVYVFNTEDGLDNYQYMNAIYNVTPVADRWYYGKGMAYGSIG